MAAPLTRTKAKRARDSSERLPGDVLFNVLQVLPAKDVCRVRAVSRLWRSTTSHPAFIRAHADRHKEPLFLAKLWDDQAHVYVVDVSGNVVKRIAVGEAQMLCTRLQVLCTRLNRACLGMETKRCCLLNPATGGIRVLPQDPAVQHARRVYQPRTSYALGFVPSTREYKVLRAFSQGDVPGQGVKSGQFFEVLTIIGETDHAQWRARPRPVRDVDLSSLVLDGVVYFLTSSAAAYSRQLADDDLGAPAYYIVLFDLEREDWRTDLQLPPSIGSTLGACDTSPLLKEKRTLADLKGSLVLVHHPHGKFVMDLWFLLDIDSGLWVKKYSIQRRSIVSRMELGYCYLKPLLVLGDGRLVIYFALAGLLFICDPRTKTFTQVHMRRLDSVVVYTGSLLSVQEGDME